MLFEAAIVIMRDSCVALLPLRCFGRARVYSDRYMERTSFSETNAPAFVADYGAQAQATALDFEQPPSAQTPVSPQMSDEDLFARIRATGSEEAFNILYKRYDRRLYAYCLRATGSHEAAKDAFQTVMSAVFEKRASFQGGHYAAWLFTIARHHVMKVSKRQQRDVKTLSPLDDDNGREHALPSDEHFALRLGTGEGDFLLREALDRAIAQLPEDLREAFELKQYDGLQHEEIAQTLGISLSLAKVRVFRAKRQLQRLLAPFFEELQ